MFDNTISTDLIFLDNNTKSLSDENFDFFYFDKRKVNVHKWFKNKTNKRIFLLFLLTLFFLAVGVVCAVFGFENDSLFTIVISKSHIFLLRILFCILSILFFIGFVCLSVILFLKIIENKKLFASSKERKKYLNELTTANKMVLIDIGKEE